MLYPKPSPAAVPFQLFTLTTGLSEGWSSKMDVEKHATDAALGVQRVPLVSGCTERGQGCLELRQSRGTNAPRVIHKRHWETLQDGAWPLETYL